MIKKILKFFGFTLALFVLNFVTLFCVLMAYAWSMNELEMHIANMNDTVNIDYN